MSKFTHEFFKRTKKIERMQNSCDEQIKKLNEKLSETQKSLYEKNVELKVALEGINQLNKELKCQEENNMKSNTHIMKLESRLASKNTIKKGLKKLASQRL